MTPSEAEAQYGATHYATMRDGVTPQMYYKLETTPLNDGTSFTAWVYLSYCNLWQGSDIRRGSPGEGNLKEIVEVKLPEGS